MYSFLKKIGIILLCIACPAKLWAQTGEQADSLLDNFYSSLPNDTNKVNQLYKTGYELRIKDIPSAFNYANLCLETALEIKSDKHLAKAYNLLGVLCFRTGKLDKALRYHNEALLLRKKLKDNEGIAFSQLNIGNVYADQNLKTKAEEAYLEAMNYFNGAGNLKYVANTLNNIGILKSDVKEYEAAGNYFKRALTIAGQLNDYELKATTNNNLGTVYENLKDYKLAQEYFEEALELRELMDNEIEMADSYINIASTSFELKNTAQSKQLLKKALQICEKNEYTEGSISIYNFLKDIFITENKLDSALLYQKLFYEEREKTMALAEDSETLTKTTTVIDDTKVHELRNDIYLLKYIIGVLSVFLVILFLALRRLK